MTSFKSFLHLKYLDMQTIAVTLPVLVQVNGGSQSFNTVNILVRFLCMP